MSVDHGAVLEALAHQLADAVAKGDRSEAETLVRKAAPHLWPTALFLERWAASDLQDEDFTAARDKLSLLLTLRPDVAGFRRLYVNAVMQLGDADAVYTELAKFDLAALPFEHLHWQIMTLIHMGDDARAKATIEDLRSRRAFPEQDLEALSLLVLAEEGPGDSAMVRLAELAAGAQPSGWAMQLLSSLWERRGGYAEAAELLGRRAILFDAPHLMGQAIDFDLFLGRPDVALARLEKLLDAQPSAAGIVENLKPRVAQELQRIRQVLDERGPVQPFDRPRIVNALSTHVPANEIAWGRLALLELVHTDGLTPEDADIFLKPWANWESGQVGRLLNHRLRHLVGANAPLRRRVASFLALDRSMAEAMTEFVNQIGPEAFDEDSAFLAIFLLRFFEVASQAAQQRMAERLSRLRQMLVEFLPRAKASFRAYSAAHLVALKLDPHPSIGPADDADRLAVHRLTVYGRLPWAGDRTARRRISRAPLRPRLVLGISGQLRGFERAWPSLLDAFVRPYSAPVAMSVWAQSSNAIGRHARRLERCLPREVIGQIDPHARYTDLFEREYPATYQAIFGVQKVEPARLETILRSGAVREYHVEVEEEPLYDKLLIPDERSGTSGLLKIFAKMYRLEQIISGMEDERGEAFTHVVWARADTKVLRFSQRLLGEMLEDTNSVWGDGPRPTTIGDYFLIMPRTAFRDLSGLFPAAVLTGSLGFFGWVPEQLLELPGGLQLRGPEGLAQAFFARGWRLREARSIRVDLVGYMPPEAAVIESFERERKLTSQS